MKFLKHGDMICQIVDIHSHLESNQKVSKKKAHNHL